MLILELTLRDVTVNFSQRCEVLTPLDIRPSLSLKPCSYAQVNKGGVNLHLGCILVM